MVVGCWLILQSSVAPRARLFSLICEYITQSNFHATITRMNTFNKIFTIFMLIVLLVVLSVALIVPPVFINLIQMAANTLHNLLFVNMSDAPAARLLVRVALAALFALIILFILFLQLRRPRPKTVEVAQESGGKVRVMNETIERRLQDQIEGLGDMVNAKVKVTERGKAVSVNVEAFTTQTGDPIAKGTDVARVISDVIENQLGLRLNGKPTVVVKNSRAKNGKPQTTALPPSSVQSTSLATTDETITN